jgi:hypothetical protein
MKRFLLCIAVSVSALAETHVRFVPPIPTNLTPVTIYYDGFGGAGGCGVDALGAVVKREGRVITVLLQLKRVCIIATPPLDWSIAVPLGTLEPGNYEVRTNATNVVVDDIVRFSVLDATTFPISPPGAPLHAFPPYELRGPSLYDGADIRIGNVEATVNGRLDLTYGDDLAALGLADVEVTMANGEKVIARNAFTFYDSHEITPPLVFEDVFVPIYFNGRGSTGDWRTELALRSIHRRESSIPFWAPWGSTHGGFTDVNNVAYPLDPRVIGNRPNGFYLRVARNGVEALRCDLKVWDAEVVGTVQARVPVVRERDWLAGLSDIGDLPLGEGRRVTVRVYAPDDDLQSVKVTRRGVNDVVLRPVRHSSNAPRYASLEFTSQATDSRSFMEFMPSPFGTRYWVLVTITDSKSHELIVLTPQPKGFWR